MLKRILMLALLCTLIVSAKTGGKTYSFKLQERAVAGTAQLKPGDYRLKVDGGQVVLMNEDGKIVDANARLETAERKFDQTAILSSQSDGTQHIVSIQLGGTTYSVIFE